MLDATLTEVRRNWLGPGKNWVLLTDGRPLMTTNALLITVAFLAKLPPGLDPLQEISPGHTRYNIDTFSHFWRLQGFST